MQCRSSAATGARVARRSAANSRTPGSRLRGLPHRRRAERDKPAEGARDRCARRLQIHAHRRRGTVVPREDLLPRGCRRDGRGRRVLRRRPRDVRRHGRPRRLPPARPVVPARAPGRRAVGLRFGRAAGRRQVPAPRLQPRLRREHGHGLLLPPHRRVDRRHRRGPGAHGRHGVAHGARGRQRAPLLAADARERRAAPKAVRRARRRRGRSPGFGGPAEDRRHFRRRPLLRRRSWRPRRSATT